MLLGIERFTFMLPDFKFGIWDRKMILFNEYNDRAAA